MLLQIEDGNMQLWWEKKEKNHWCGQSAYAEWGLVVMVMFL